MMRSLFRQEGANLSVDIVTDPDVRRFISAHADLLDSSFSQVDMSDSMRRHLQQSDYIFSGMKTFHELNEAFPSLIDENGVRKPFEQFLNDVQKIDNTYNRNYLRAEYNFAHASAQMASRWEQFAADGDRYNLQYRTANDGSVRPEHAALHGVTLPPSDPFWQSYFPPNGWNCRCTAVQVRKDKYPETPHDEAEKRAANALSRDHRGMFRFNPGIQRKTFPDYNPYTISRCRDCDIAKGNLNLAFIPEYEQCAACKLLRCINKGQNKALYQQLLNDSEYTNVEYHERSGGVKGTHIEHSFDGKKGWYEEKSQNAGFHNGHSVLLCAEHHNIYKHRNCEGLWDGLPFEIAGAETATSNNIRNALKHCAKKPGSKVAVIFFPNDNYSVEEFNLGYSKFYGLRGTSQYKKFDLIVCIHDESIIQMKKPSD